MVSWYFLATHDARFPIVSLTQFQEGESRYAYRHGIRRSRLVQLRDGSELKRGGFFSGRDFRCFYLARNCWEFLSEWTHSPEQAPGKNGENTNILGNQKLNCGGDDYERVSLTFRHLLDTRRMLSSGSKPDLETATETRTETVATACPEEKGRMGGWVTRATKNFQISGQGFSYGIDLWTYIDLDFFS